MSKKIFYFIRHGESLLNAAHIRQGAEGGLSEKGKLQAEKVGKNLSSIHFEAFLVSPFERTKETALLMSPYITCDSQIEYIDLLVERRNPTEIIGKPADNSEVMHIVDLIDKSYHNDDFRYSDEENFSDLKIRARKLLLYLAHRKENTVLVITHSIFLKMIASYILHGENLNAQTYNLLSFVNSSSNASVTILTYDSGWLGDGYFGRLFFPPEKRWRLVTWDK